MRPCRAFPSPRPSHRVLLFRSYAPLKRRVHPLCTWQYPIACTLIAIRRVCGCYRVGRWGNRPASLWIAEEFWDSLLRRRDLCGEASLLSTRRTFRSDRAGGQGRESRQFACAEPDQVSHPATVRVESRGLVFAIRGPPTRQVRDITHSPSSSA